jgi:hypothetical protein
MLTAILKNSFMAMNEPPMSGAASTAAGGSNEHAATHIHARRRLRDELSH